MGWADTKIRLNRINQDISRMKRLRELVDYIPETALEKVAGILLLVWVSMPAVVLVLGLFLKEGDLFQDMMNQTTRNLLWLKALELIVLFSIMLAVVWGLKKYFHSRRTVNDSRERSSWISWLKANLTVVCLFLLLAWSAVSCLLSDNRLLSFQGTTYRSEGLLTYLYYVGIFFCASLIRDRRLIIRIMRIYCVVATILSILLILNLDFINYLFQLYMNSTVFYNANHFAYYLVIAIMISIFLVFNATSWYMLLIDQGIFCILVAALIVNKSAGPYLAVCTGLIIASIVIFLLNRRYLRRIILVIASFTIVSLVMQIFDPTLMYDLLSLFIDINEVVNNTDKAIFAGTGRWALWVNAVRFIKEKPLFGFGPDNLGAQYATVDIQIDRPHNEFLQVAASLGIPALIFYLTALLAFFIRYLKRFRQLPLLVTGLVLVALTYLISSLFGNTMFYTYPYFLMFFGLANGLVNGSRTIVE